MDEYNVAEEFERIEHELIASMMRNFDKHRAEEDEKGINWSQWQVEQLQALEEYKKHNAKKYGTQFKDINSRIDELIKSYRKEGNTRQEVDILKAIKKGMNYEKTSPGVSARFFKLNDKKIDALIDATKNDFKKAEYAMLRRSNDQYRQIVFRSVLCGASGGTYEKAVDMAAKEFLRKGIDCIEYKNGSRHNIKDYADMAIKTAGKRAYLTGEGEKRKEYGITTVIMNKRGNPCPKCLPFVGKVMIDDVWSGGKASDGPYMLMSDAIAKGLYHPRCKDSHSTYYPGISSEGAEYTKEEKQQVINRYNAEQKENYAESQAEKFGRLAEYSLDGENRRMYKARAEEWKERIEKNSKDDIEGADSGSVRSDAQKMNEKESIDALNERTQETLLRNYEERRLNHGLNETPASELQNNPLNPIKADFKGVSVETAEVFSSTIENLMNEYDSGLTKIVVGDKKEFFGAKAFATTRHNNSVGQKELILNPHKTSDINKLTERIEELSSKGYAVNISEGKASQYIATHEFAHSLIDMESPLKNWVGIDEKPLKQCRKEIKALYAEYTSNVNLLSKKYADAEMKAMFSVDESDWEAARKLKEQLNKLKISNYSMENADEFFAEAFTQAKIGKFQSEYSLKVMKTADKYFKKEPLEKIVESSKIKVRRFNTLDDPLREVTGAAVASNPTEINNIIEDLIESGAEIIYREGTMAYTPALSVGKAGQFLIDKEASYGAWLHEYKHFCDDRDDGYLGMRVFSDSKKCKQREINAYQIEIDIAEKLGREDIVKRLEKLRNEEVSKYE